jgi:predicted permease
VPSAAIPWPAIAVISLGAGIGATALTLVMRDAIFLAPPPLYAEPHDLLLAHAPTPENPRRLVPAGLFHAWTIDPVLADGLAGVAPTRQQDVRAGDQQASAAIRPVTRDLFTRLGVQPMLGTPLEAWPIDGPPPAVLSAGVWSRLFGERAEVVGSSILIDDVPHTVIAVMPRRFWFADMIGPIWTRLDTAGLNPETPLHVVIRQPAALSARELRDRLRATATRYAAGRPADRRQLTVTTRPLRGTPVGDNIGPMVLILLTGAVVLTLAIACTNVSILMMAQWTAREHEIAIRASLGGSRGRIIRALVAESTAIAVAGGLLGFAVVFALRGLARRSVPTADLYDLTVAPAVFAQITLVTLAVGLITGLAPALYETRRLHANPLIAIRGSDRVRQRWRHGLVVFEIAATVALLVVTGAMLSSYDKSLTESPGFDTRPLLAARLDAPGGVDAAPVLEHLRAVPGVASTAVATMVPFISPGPSQPQQFDRSALPIEARVPAVGPGYFDTLGVPMRAGRAFSAADVHDGARVAVVNEVLAAQLWGLRGADLSSAVGREIQIRERPHTVVGVVSGFAVTANQPHRPMAFTPWAQLDTPPARAQVVVRASGDAGALAQTVRHEIAALGGRVQVAGVVTADQIRQIIGQEIIVGTFPLFPLIATGMLLTAAGIYGVLAFAITRRATELAVRLAVGATPRNLVRLVAAHCLRLLGLGTAIGIALTYALTRLAQGRGGVFDSPGWQAFVVPILLIALVACAATLIPMRRTLAIHPASLLRSQ